MIGWEARHARVGLRRVAALAAGLWIATLGTTATAGPETRTLRLFHINLRESSEITFKRDGRYLPDGLKKANWALRDWRRNQPTSMDPRLLDLLWEAYQKSGSRVPIQVIGGYRAPETNKMLRSRSARSGVAENSQHVLGKAVDFFIPDVPLARLREIGLKMQIGGVGFYPRSGAPFVHFDVGSGRYWPRMSRNELARIFPDGKTIHLPADGKPLPGYAEAMASYKKRKGSSELMVADAGSAAPRRSLLAALFGGGRDEEEDRGEVAAPAARSRADKPAADAPAARTLGVAMPDAGFDASAPALAPAPEPLVAALARVPLPTRAPARPEVGEEIVGAPAQDDTLLAALAEAPVLPAAFARGVPTPQARPVFETILGSSADVGASPPPLLASALASPEPASPAARAATPSRRPVLLEASLDARPLGSNVAAHQAPHPAPADGRGGRVARGPFAPRPAAKARPTPPQDAIAALIADPARRALEENLVLPDAERLLAERPHDILALGFAPTGGRPQASDRFTGRAVHFLPVRRLD